MLHVGRWTADGLAVRPTEVKTGIFDNEPNPTEELWGLYLSRALPRFHSNVDLYYLGYGHKLARYAQGTGREQREMIGARVWGHTPTWDYDFEYTAQFGRFSTGNIQAWGTGIAGILTHAPETQPHGSSARRSSRSSITPSADISAARWLMSISSPVNS